MDGGAKYGCACSQSKSPCIALGCPNLQGKMYSSKLSVVRAKRHDLEC